MAAVETLTTIKANALLNMGTTTTGSVRTTPLSLGTLDPNGWDAAKVMAITDALEPLLTRTVYELTGVKTYRLSESS